MRDLIERQKGVPLEERRPIGEMAVAANYLDQARLLSVLDRNASRLNLGELLVMRGHLTLKDLADALQEQSDAGEPIGEVLVRMKKITKSQLAACVAEQCEIAHVPISGIPPDRNLIRWINESFARSHEVVPIACRGRNLVLAVWRPSSLAAAVDVEQATGLNVSVVLTTREEIQARVRDLYGPGKETGQAA